MPVPSLRGVAVAQQTPPLSACPVAQPAVAATQFPVPSLSGVAVAQQVDPLIAKPVAQPKEISVLVKINS